MSTCPRCDGAKTISITGINMQSVIDCPLCAGTGEREFVTDQYDKERDDDQISPD